ncbi:MAG TPA: oligosaccharide flippase family protein [Vicinamibacterales bacterium]|nr:oligosaccharide flippase family protein [Vicinamibacterales bacterium]
MITHTREAVVARRAAWLVLYRGASDVTAKGVMLVITVAAARRLTREEFALFALASTLGWLGSVAADFGIQVHLAREVSQRPHLAADLLRRWLPVRVATGAAALALAATTVPALGLGRDALLPILLFTVAYAATGMSECLYYFFRGLERTDLESTFTLAQRAIMAGLAIGVLWLRPDITLLAGAMLLPAVLTLGLTAATARRLAAGRDQGRRVIAMPRGDEFLHSVAPIGLGILLSALYFRVDLFLLERWSGETAVALYNAVFRLVDALRLFPAAVLAVTLPGLCRASDRRPVTRLAARLTAAATGAAVVLWLAAAWLVPAIYGEPYRDAVAPFRTLVAALPLMALNYALTHQLIGWHGQRAYAGICAGALGCNLFLNWHLIPALGMSGAAWATLWTEFVLTAGCVIALSRTDPARPVFPAGAANIGIGVRS